MMEPVHRCSSKCPHRALRTQGRASLTHSGEAPQTILPLGQIQLFYKPMMRIVFILAFVRLPHADGYSLQEK